MPIDGFLYGDDFLIGSSIFFPGKLTRVLAACFTFYKVIVN